MSRVGKGEETREWGGRRGRKERWRRRLSVGGDSGGLVLKNKGRELVQKQEKGMMVRVRAEEKK